MASAAAATRTRRGFFSDPLFRAFAFSLVVHVAIFASALIPSINFLKRAHAQLMAEKRQADREIQLSFMEVNLKQAAPEAPKDAKFYGSINVQPANAAKEAAPAPQPLQPSVSPPVPVAPKVEAKPVEIKSVGDLALGKPTEPVKRVIETPKPSPAPPVATKPSQEVKPDPTVKQNDIVTSPGVKSTLAGDYDQRFVEKVQRHWDQMLLIRTDTNEPGKVVVDFRLSYDGRVSDLTVRETTVNEMQTMLCRKAILDPAPYDRWSTDLRKEIKQDLREVTFTFYYSK